MLHLEINKPIQSVQHLPCRTPIALKHTNEIVGAIKKRREKKSQTTPSITAKQIPRHPLRALGKLGIHRGPRNLNKVLKRDNYQIHPQPPAWFNKAHHALKVGAVWIRSTLTSPHTSRDNFPVVGNKTLRAPNYGRKTKVEQRTLHRQQVLSATSSHLCENESRIRTWIKLKENYKKTGYNL